ncbi:MAG TPA: hypothetical protein VG742_01200, partial [Dongiaceae bacterium]|nr:hypothetical protein [Dongiaceae bacterium]
KEIKTWRRIWKIELIETKNHLWRDLYPDLIPGAVIPGGHSPTPESRRGRKAALATISAGKAADAAGGIPVLAAHAPE